MKAHLEVTGLSKTYQGRAVLQDIHLQVKKGEIFTLLGPSGAGKSTLLNCLNGMTAPDEGSIILNGRDITRSPLHERNVATVFQNFKLFEMSVAQNVAYPLNAKKIRSIGDSVMQLFRGKDRSIEGEVTRMLSTVKLSAHAGKHPQQLSGGEQQRVALARALICRPDLLCLDEPLASLDNNLKYELLEEMRSIQREFGQTFVYITHDQNEAFTFSDRIAVMYDGRILQTGSPVELYHAPQSDFVARFIGEYNLFEPGPQSDWGNEKLVTADGACLSCAKKPEPGQVAGILPEHLVIGTGMPDARPFLYGKIRSKHFVKGFARFAVVLEQGRTVMVNSPLLEHLSIFQQEMPVYLSYDPKHVLPLQKIIIN